MVTGSLVWLGSERKQKYTKDWVNSVQMFGSQVLYFSHQNLIREVCQLHTVSFVITITFLKDSLNLVGIPFSNPKMSRKGILEPDVRAFGQKECNPAFRITSSILISESWPFLLNFLFWWRGRRGPCLENSRRQWSLDGALGMS